MNDYQNEYMEPHPDEFRSNTETLRDRFAMAALTGLLARGDSFDYEPAEVAYKYANEMMKARE